MCHSEQVNEIFSALAKAQGIMGVAIKDSTNPFYKSNYADLEAVVGISRGPLSENGLCVTQPPVKGDPGEILTTILGHSSGQWIKSEIVLRPPKADPQSLGSYITYMRRYAYSSIVGVVTKDDDDGEKAMVRVTSAQIKALKSQINGDMNLENDILKQCSIKKIEELPESHYENILNQIIEYNKAFMG